MRGPMRILFLMAMGATTACNTYEYEEEVFLNVDGSGTLRVSGSSSMLEALHDVDGSPASMERHFGASGFDIDSVRATERDGRTFVHVQGRFDDWNELCAHPAFQNRACRLTNADASELTLHLRLPPPSRDFPSNVPADASLAIRFHFPSTVRFHNSPSGIERGNILAWTRKASEHFDASALVVDVRFEKRSVLATTLGIIGTAVGLVALSVAAALLLMVRKGRRQLATEARAEREDPIRLG